MKKLVIDRSKWQRGEGYAQLLDDETGKMCCLGIYLRACGKAPSTIANRSFPCQIPNRLFPKEADWLLEGLGEDRFDSAVANKLMYVNDSRMKTEKQRETFIKETFAKQGIKVEFVGE